VVLTGACEWLDGMLVWGMRTSAACPGVFCSANVSNWLLVLGIN